MISRPLLTVLLFALAAELFAAVELEISPRPMTVDQSARLSFAVSDGRASEPDFSALESDFEILGRNRKSSLKWLNGRREQTTTWVLNVMPRNTGEIRIPSFDFGAGRSPEQTVTVVAASAQQEPAEGHDIVLEVDAQPRNPYVQQQVIYTVRLLHRVELSSPRFSPLKTSADAIVKPLGEGRQFVEARNGIRYDAYERRYAIYPQQSGSLNIDPLVLTTQVVRGVRSLFDPFSQALQSRRVSAEALNLDVRPVPDSFPDDATWLPARRVRLNEEWSPQATSADVGTPLSRTLFLWADGLVAGQLPEINFTAPDNAKLYPDQAQTSEKDSANGFTAVMQQKFAVIAGSPGEIIFEALALPWWNTETDSLEYARLDKHVLAVTGATAAAAGERPAAPAETRPAPPASAGDQTAPWRLASAALAMAWLCTLFLWWRSQRRTGEDGIARPRRAAPAEASLAAVSKSVKLACDANDRAAAAQALLAWGSAAGAPGSRCRSLRDVAALATTDALNAAIGELERARYGADQAVWNGARLWDAFRREPRPKRHSSEQGGAQDDLPPLFKLAHK